MAWFKKSKIGRGVRNFVLTATAVTLLSPLGELIAQNGKTFNDRYIKGNVLLQACKDETYLKNLKQSKVDELINITFNNAISLANDFQKVHSYESADDVLKKALVDAKELNLSDISKRLETKITENKIECGKYIITSISSPYTSAREAANILKNVFIKHKQFDLVTDEIQYSTIEDVLINKTTTEFDKFMSNKDYKLAVNLLEQVRGFAERRSFDRLATYCEKSLNHAQEVTENSSTEEIQEEKKFKFKNQIAESINKQMESERHALGIFKVGGKEYVAAFEIAIDKNKSKAQAKRDNQVNRGVYNCTDYSRRFKKKIVGGRQLAFEELKGRETYKYFIMIFYEVK